MTSIRQLQAQITRVGLGLWCLFFFVSMANGTGGLPLQAELGFGFSQEQFRLLGWAGAAAALCFAAGFAVRVSAWGALLCLQLFLQLLPMIREVSYPYLSMMLIVFGLFYEGKGLFVAQMRRREVWWLAFFLAVYAGLSLSGAAKVSSPLWQSGEAFSLLCQDSPLSRWAGAGACNLVPPRAACLLAAGVELAAFPLAIFPRTRLLAWCLVTLLQLGIFFLVSVWPVTVAMLLLQLFLFDADWLDQRWLP